MKKLMMILLSLVLVISLCACGGKVVPTQPAETTAPATTDPTQAPTEPATSGGSQLGALTPEQLYGHINQLEPNNGVYQIWNEVGVQNMAEHPEASFKLLCNIDMQGATVRPIGTQDKPFTGELDGNNCTISNFTVAGGDETAFGFVGVNQGKIQKLVMKDVTLIPGANAQYIGALVGRNEGEVIRCDIFGTMEVNQAAAQAVCGSLTGHNAGKLANDVVEVDLLVSADNVAFVGGIAGTSNGGEVEFVETNGKLVISGSNQTVGLFAGDAQNTVFKNCVFIGAANTQNDILFTNFTGNPEDDERVVALKGKARDNAYIQPLPEKVQAVRDKVVQAMYDLCTVEWHVTQDLVHSCTCQLSGCHGTYSSAYTYKGIPYNHKCSSVARFVYCLNEDKSIADWFYDLASYDGFDVYIGGDCSSTVQQAWWTVSNSTNIWNTRYIPEVYGQGTITVGEYTCDFELKSITKNGVATKWTEQYIEATEEQVMYESYAACRPGDAIVNQIEPGGHTRMIAANPVIVRDQDGNIDPNYSYVLTHEQGASITDDVNMVTSSCRTNWKYTFGSLYGEWYVPVTCEELVTGDLEPVEAKLEGACAGYGGMLTGQVKANYQLDYVTLTIVNSKGEEVLDHPMFSTVQKVSDYGNAYYTARCYVDSMDMADFAAALTKVQFVPGESYSYTVTANLATFDNIVVHEGSFNFGSAQ